jgi:hypothetical protein
MKLLRVAIVIFLLMQICKIASAQNKAAITTDELVKKFEYYSAKKQQGVLFAHFDKNIYTSNEYIWFTAYLLKDTSDRNNVLSVAMINDNDRTVVLKDKFVMDGGYSSGNIFLPDTVPPGNYSFMLYTNTLANGQPENVFIQPVTVKGTSQLSYTASLLLKDTDRIAPATGRKVLLVAEAPGAGLISGAKVSYYLGDKTNPIMAGTVKTDAAGQYLFTIPTKGITLANNVLQVKVSYGGEVKDIKLALPVQKNVPVVKFYPEGGNLSDGITSVVGWEVKNREGSYYAAKGTLYKDDKPVDTVSTNVYGMGKFSLQSNQESHYYVKLADNPDSAYNLPKILSNSPVVTIVNSIVNDTLRLVVKNKLPAKFYVLVHNYQQTFASFPVQADAGGKTINVNLKDVPRGLAEVTILDSLQQPYAERLFFAHYSQRNTLNVVTDNSEYKPRQKVSVKLDITGADGKKPGDGFVSIACVQANRLDANKTMDIESYFYLNNELGAFPVKQNYLSGSAADKAFLENMLLIKGWRRYTWNELVQTTGNDAVKKDESLIFTGNITHLNKPIKKAVNYAVIRDSSRSSFTSLANGNFTLANKNMYVTENEKVRIFAAGIDGDEYFFNLLDPYVKANKQLADHYELPYYNYALVNEKKAAPESLKGFEHAIQLKEVRIMGANDTLMNACGDYYCINGILNCPNHHHDAQNKIPVKGKTYYLFNPLTEAKKPFVYKGCNPDDDDAVKGFNGIHYNMEFYPADYVLDNPSEPDYISTIYWNHLYSVSPDNTAEISFYTSDITGAFKIIVQGTTDKGVVYGEKSFTVSK